MAIPQSTIPAREPRPEKVAQVAALAGLLARSEAVVLADYRGLTVAEKADLTRRLREAGAEFHVVKNTLFRLAYGSSGEDPGAMLQGPTAVAFAFEEPVKPLRALLDFIRETRKGSIKGALMDGRVFDPEGVTRLSELPPREVLMGQLVGALQGPIYGLIFTLQGVMSHLVRTLQAIQEQKAGAGEALS